MRFPIGALVLSMLVLTACGGHQSSATSAPSASAAAVEASPSVSPSADAIATIAPGATPTPVTVPSPTPNPNILDVANGTVLRSYSPPQLDDTSDGSLGDAANGVGSEFSAAAKPPYVFTFELPGVASITGFEVVLNAPNTNDPTPSATVEVSNQSATAGFHAVGTVTQIAGQSLHMPIAANVQARWVRVTWNLTPGTISATGTVASAPSKVDPSGMYIEDPVPDLNGAFITSGRKTDDNRVRIVANGNEVVATECGDREAYSSYIGTFDGRQWAANFAGDTSGNPDKIRGAFNDEGTIFAGRYGDGANGSVVFTRTTDTPKFCQPQVQGTGLHHYLVLDQNPYQGANYPLDVDPSLPGYTFSKMSGGMLTPASLQGQDGAIVRGICHVDNWLGANQRQLLLNWVSSGHKLIVWGDGCHDDSDYTWLPYPLKAVQGQATGNASLIQVEDSALGTNDKQDAAHFVDVAPYVANGNNDLGATYLVSTQDPHWCGHFFVAKPNNLNGFVQAYTTFGTGFIIFDGFDGLDSGYATLQRLRTLELQLPVPSSLPCEQLASESFVLAPSQELTFNVGSSPTTGAQLQLLANQGFNGHATVTASGDLGATVKPSSFDIAGGVQGLNVAVNTGAAKKAGLYTVTIAADNGSGKKSSATLVLTGNAPIRKAAMALHQRIRIYGIHFDYDSATIQSKSEPLIADIAALLKANPSWHFEVSGHTDSDGGASYNLNLSQRRAQSVVDDLVKRYHIASSRLVAKGYGLTRPVASNATDAGKALNRRVELERIK